MFMTSIFDFINTINLDVYDVESEGKVIIIGRDGCLPLLSLLSEMASFAGEAMKLKS
jgi:hypothetical protein